ncbi:packaged DNA stabilization protein [Bradyrhizobium sp. C9]|uniref:packaged DNA stabilization protein n=1 Tax=Bradyrhizobium sp. C9 TaxID=142585 RepID=UPI000BEA5946|nr:packaged DNA stabilization protein [Bradyrhizobium sp. C9]PDT74123.1 hypothetical protein CO675_27005 [Bradyrhizobium sp. C9]
MVKRSIPFPVQTAPGAKSQEGGGRIINGYAEELGDQAPNKTVIRRGPGLVNFGTAAGRSGYRGAIIVQNVLYVAFNGKLEKWTAAGGASVNIGNLNGTRRGFFSSNNNTTPDKVFVDPDGNVATFTPTTVTNSYPDPDLPAVNSVDFLDGYLVFTTGDGRAFATDLNSTSVNALSFGKAEAKPDGLVRVVAWGGRLLLFGTISTEVWTDAGTTPFPFARATVIPRGLAGPYCVSAYEDGLSRGPIFVGDDNCIYKLDGYTPTKVSTPDIEGLIEAVTDKTTLEATAYISRGHAFFQLSSPAWTWVLDISTSQWAQRDSYQQTRSRISGAINAFGQWLTGDTQTGNLQSIQTAANDEVSNPLRLRIESGPVMDFPGGSVVGRADFYFTTGIGIATGRDPDQTDPQVEISWSDDGGLTWSNPILRKLGRQSEPRQLISLVSCTGRTSWQGRRWRLDVSSAVYSSFMFGTMSDDPRAA